MNDNTPKPQRRPRGAGSIRQRPDGRWEARLHGRSFYGLTRDEALYAMQNYVDPPPNIAQPPKKRRPRTPRKDYEAILEWESPKRKTKLRDFFWYSVDKSAGESACWPFKGMLRLGYGILHVAGRNWAAHRLAYAITKGLPAKLSHLDVDHLCRNRRCVNPAHLELVTTSVNAKRAHENRKVCKRGHDFSNLDNLRVKALRNGTLARYCEECERQRYHAGVGQPAGQTGSDERRISLKMLERIELYLGQRAPNR